MQIYLHETLRTVFGSPVVVFRPFISGFVVATELRFGAVFIVAERAGVGSG
jgi:hypothetical protein